MWIRQLLKLKIIVIPSLKNLQKLKRIRNSRKHLLNYGQFGQDLQGILRQMRLSILNDQSNFCTHLK